MEWLKQIREEKRMTGSYVAKEAGISQPTYSYIESGRKKPGVAVAKRIAAVLGFEWTRFFDEKGA